MPDLSPIAASEARLEALRPAWPTAGGQLLLDVAGWMIGRVDIGQVLQILNALETIGEENKENPRTTTVSGHVVVTFGGTADEWCKLTRCPMGTAPWFPDREAANAYCQTLPDWLQPHILIVQTD